MPDASQKNHDEWRIPDALWERIVPLLPPRQPHPVGCHRRRVDDRKARDALCCVRRPGCQWGALDATGICSHSAAHRRWQAWTAADGCVALEAQGLVASDALQGIDWAWRALDGAMPPAPLGGETGRQASHGSRQDGYQAQSPHRRRRTDRPRGRWRQSP